MAPKMAKLILPARIMAKESADEKNEEPGRVVTVCLPALIKSASTSSSRGKGPMPSSPFSDCNQTRSEEHTSELQSRGHLVCRLLLEKKKITNQRRNNASRRTTQQQRSA